MAASNYAACLTKVLRYEGGYVNDPHDPGGETNYGITVAVARANGYTGAMRNIPMDLVRKIYKTKYWDAVNGDALPPGIDLCVFDFAVNSGPARAKALQFVAGTPQAQIEAYCNARLAFLKRLKTWPRYGKGWNNRVADVRATALKMASAPGGVATKTATDTTKIGGGVAAGGAVVAAGGAAAVDSGWGWFEWSIAIVVVLILVGAAVYGWHWWKARKARRDQIGAVALAAVADAISSPASPKDQSTPKPNPRAALSQRRASKPKAKKIAKKRRA